MRVCIGSPFTVSYSYAEAVAAVPSESIAAIIKDLNFIIVVLSKILHIEFLVFKVNLHVELFVEVVEHLFLHVAQ